MLEEQRDADVLAALERVGEREEAAAGHAVAGVGVGARHVEVELAAERCRRSTITSVPTMNNAASHAGGVVERVERARSTLARAARVLHIARYASIDLLAFGAGLAQPLREHVVADLLQVGRELRRSGFTIVMPLAFSWSRYQPFFSSDSFQPRVSASAAALSTRLPASACRARRTPSC